MNRPVFKYLLIAILSIITVFAFGACGSSDDDGGSKESGTPPTEVVSDYDTVVYTYTDNSDEEDLYSVTVTFEYDGDKVMGVTEVTVDDRTAADDDIAQMLIEDDNGYLDDSGLKEMDGVVCDVYVNGKVRTETRKFDLTKFDNQYYKKYVGIESDKDYISYDDLTGVYEAAGYVKKEAE